MLTNKQLQFCNEYIIDLNATQAAIRAGYSGKTAQEQSSRLLSNVIVQQKIQEFLDRRAKKNEITADKVLQELARIAFIDIAQIFDDSGHVKPISQIPEDARRAIGSIETLEKYNTDGDYEGDVRRVKLVDKRAALEALGRHLKLFTEKIEHSGKVTLEQLLSESKSKIA